jgi:hypothetical protein
LADDPGSAVLTLTSFGEQELDGFARRVLQSTLEQRRMRQAREGE